jgi:hypothetical protein
VPLDTDWKEDDGKRVLRRKRKGKKGKETKAPF